MIAMSASHGKGCLARTGASSLKPCRQRWHRGNVTPLRPERSARKCWTADTNFAPSPCARPWEKSSSRNSTINNSNRANGIALSDRTALQAVNSATRRE